MLVLLRTIALLTAAYKSWFKVLTESVPKSPEIIPPIGGPVGVFKTVDYIGLFWSQVFFMGVDEIQEVDVFLVADIEAVHRDMVVEVCVELV